MTGIRAKIEVDSHYTRAVNVERDGAAAGVESYILTGNARRLLRRIAEAAAKEKTTRAWTLVGPYGAGKSAFALFLSALLASRDTKHGAAARKLCKREDEALADKYEILTKAQKGFCPVFVTGAREAMAPRLLARLTDALDKYFDGKSPPVIAALREAAEDNAPVSKVVELFRRAAAAVIEHGGGGLLVVVDEMGKFLEYDAETPDSDNAYLLQSLSETTLARGKKDAHIFMLGVLHHGFGFYTRGFGDDARAEWQKVEGRFAQLSFSETPEQMLRLMSRAIRQQFTDAEKKEIRAALSLPAKTLYESGIFEEQTFTGEVEDLFAPCYPLHPLTAALLALLSQKAGQNERTLLGYLAGEHPCGFANGVKSLQRAGDFIPPWELFDYFADGGAFFAADPVLSRRQAEIDDALHRLGNDAPLEQVQMLKTIALFNIVGARGKFAASDVFISALFGKRTKTALAALRKRSIVVYRRYADEYRIWQGSDFDLEDALRREVDKTPPFCLADELNAAAVAPPLVAHRHAIKTGNIRRLPLRFVDAETMKENKAAENAEPRLIVYLTKGEQECPLAARELLGGNDLLTVGRGSDALESARKERRALEIIVNLPDLRGDPVAKNEVKERLAQTARTERRLVSSLIAPFDGRIVHWRGEELEANNRRRLQAIVSDALDKIYNKAPRVTNEMINRENPSAQAAAARNKLLAALRRNVGVKDLGIEKYPPEKALYLSLLKNTGLHRYEEKKWRLFSPQENGEHNFHPVWKRLDDFLDDTKTIARAFTELEDELCAPPYGVKRGLLEIFYALAIFANEGELAVYEDGAYQPFFQEYHLERFLVRPDTFTFRRVRIGTVGAGVLRSYQSILGGKSKRGEMLAITRPLSQHINALPDYAKNTKRLSKQALGFCRAVGAAKSPWEMLLEDIPKALGFSQQELSSETKRSKFAAMLTEVMAELDGALPGVKNKFGALLAQGADLPKDAPLSEVRKIIGGRFVGLDEYTVDKEGVGAFLQRALDESEDGVWLDRMLLFLSGKSAAKWEDSDCDFAEHKLAEYVRKAKELEKLRLGEGNGKGAANGNGAVLVRIVGAGREQEETVHPLENGADQQDEARQLVQKALDKLSAPERLPFLVSVIQSELDEGKQQHSGAPRATGKGKARPRAVRRQG